MTFATAAPDLDTASHETPPDPAAPPAIAAPEEGAPAAILRGTAQGLEILVDARAAIDAIAAAVTDRLELAPGFFRNTDVRVRVEHGPLRPGSLTRLDELASRFELRIVEIGPARRPGFDRRSMAAVAATPEPVPEAVPVQPSVPVPEMIAAAEPAAEPEPAIEPAVAPEPVVEAAPAAAPVVEAVVSAPAPAPAPAPVVEVPASALASAAVVADELADELELDEATPPAGTRVVVGPVRSGVILEHASHIIVFGDVNPGAEIRAGGSIAVMGRLRGTAHAGMAGRDGFILALRLQPQQLRIGRIVARADDSDTPAAHAEIAHVTAGTIIVEEYRGRLPNQLAASLQEELHG